MNGSDLWWVRALANLIALFLYFTPTFVGWLRARGPSAGPAVPVGLLFVLNLLLGWTVFGWVAVLVIACREPHATSSATATAAGPGGVPLQWEPSGSPAAADWEATTAMAAPMEATENQPCPRCGGQGEVCPRCQGRRGEFALPTGESGTSSWVPCSYCVGSGRVQCGSCGSRG